LWGVELTLLWGVDVVGDLQAAIIITPVFTTILALRIASIPHLEEKEEGIHTWGGGVPWKQGKFLCVEMAD